MAARRGSLGDWIKVASSVEPELAAAPRAKRREILDRAADRFGRQAATIHRMVRAYQYALTRGKAVGLELGQIAAPVVCIELLERMERRNESVPVDLRRKVLSGEVSFQQLREEEISMRVAATMHVRDSAVEWVAFSDELSYNIFGFHRFSSVFGADRKVFSQTARNLSVDWELEFEAEKIAVFLSPQCVFSEFRGKTVLDQLPRVIMSLLFYNRVVYLPWDDSEVGLVHSYLPSKERCDTLLLSRLEIISFMSTFQGRANGDGYRL